MAPVEQTQVLPGGVRAGYALGSLVTGAFGTVPGLLLLPYLTDTLGVAAGIAGLLVLAPKAWDVLINPVAGRISDRTRTSMGARRPFLLFGGLALAVLFAGIFAAPFDRNAAYAAVMFLLAATAFAFYQVPYVAMPAEMTDDYAERTRLMSWRVAILAVAILVSGALSPMVTKQFGGGIPGHRAMGVFVALLILVGTLGSFFGTRGAPVGKVLPSEPSFAAQLRVVRASRPFRLLLICFVVQAAGIATMLAGVSCFATQILESPDTGATLLFACFVGPALLVMPLWTRVGERVGKLKAYVLASVLFAAAAALLALAPFLPAAAVYVLTGLVGSGYAGQQVFGMAMLPDCIAFDAQRTGRRQAGVFTGLWTAGETFGMALGPGVFAVLLAVFGYVSSSSGEAAAQSGTAKLGVLIGFTLVPAVVVASALIGLRGYDLDERRLTEGVT
ncbi:MFS transporter [Dactylosporangium sp. NBC_01737]|uniref:MFS transporter n=1 Tax=Dactylosporangium sp. NBC_01737 TaxID=2975959 RepID=UPI002E100487|nr:MFS transporter [Dactylosporangium sp. NBC_01737]